MSEPIWIKSYDEGVPVNVEYSGQSIPDMLRASTRRDPQAPVVNFMNATLTYEDLDALVERCASALTSIGIVKGDRVAIHLPNLPQTVIAFQAVLRIGAVVVLTNPLYTPPEIEHQWNDAGCKAAFTADFLYAAKIEPIRAKLAVEHVIICSIPEYLRFPLNLLAPLKLKRADPPLIAKIPPGPGIHHFKPWLSATTAPAPKVDIELSDLALLQYTGGTTGVSKGAMLTHANLAANVQQVGAWIRSRIDARPVFIGALPLFHVFGMTASMNLPIYLGGKIVLMANPRDIGQMLDLIDKHRVNFFPVAPAMINAINQHPRASAVDWDSLRVCVSGSAPLPEDVLKKFESRTGAEIIEAFGLTEASPATHMNPFRNRKINTVGLPISDTDARLVDPSNPDKDVALGEEGELIIKGPQIMAGYWQREDETAKTLRDGWLFTGDLCVMDDDGYFSVVGRTKEMILCSGYNVYPDEIDRALCDHPAVLEAATIGVPDEKRGETVKSFIVLEPGKNATTDEIIAHARERLAAYKVPREVEFRPELPKSAVLKILRRELRAEELAKREASQKPAN